MFSVSHTTRPMRPGEIEGVHYYFTTPREFEEMIAFGKFVEYTKLYGNYYGTSEKEVSRIMKMGGICVLELDLAGIRQVKSSVFGKTAKFIFIEPPSIDSLVERLTKRGTETAEQIKRRVDRAREEIEESQQIKFDMRLCNEDLNHTVLKLLKQLNIWYPHIFQLNAWLD